PAAESDPITRCALRVDEGVRLVAEQLPAIPTYVLPNVGAQRLGHEHRRAYRQHNSPVPLDSAGERLRRAQHVLRPNLAAVGYGHRAAALGRPRADLGD